MSIVKNLRSRVTPRDARRELPGDPRVREELVSLAARQDQRFTSRPYWVL